MSDARIGAFIGAWDRMKAAGQFRHDFRKEQPDIDVAYPPDYYALVFEAHVFATLAGASTSTGFLAGDWIEEREQREEAEKAHIQESIFDFAERKKDADDGEA